MNSITIIGIIITALIVIPIWLLIRSQNVGKRKLQKEINALGKGNNIEITEYESWKNRVIGLDRENAKGAFAILNTPESQVFIADLKQYSRCFVDKEMLNSGSKYDNNVISKINIQFVARAKDTGNLVFPIFVDSVDPNLGNELMIANKWADLFNIIIHKFSV
jgi:hypothetical protein